MRAGVAAISEHGPAKRDNKPVDAHFLTFSAWQRGGGFDRNHFCYDLIRQEIAYIEDNQVRRGLVSDPAD